MAWIREPLDPPGDPRLARLFDSIRSKAGEVASVLRVQGENRPALEAHLALYRAVMYGASPLSRSLREVLAVAVSRLNGCHY